MDYLVMPTLSNTPRPASSLVIDVPRQTSWHVPRGSYTASIRSVNLKSRLAGEGNVKTTRIVFNVDVPGSQLDYLAKVDLKLDLNEGSELWNLICRLLSRKALQDSSGGHFNLESLVGLHCDLEIDHNYDKAEDYAFPLVIVTDVQEAGRLVKPVTKPEPAKVEKA